MKLPYSPTLLRKHFSIMGCGKSVIRTVSLSMAFGIAASLASAFVGERPAYGASPYAAAVNRGVIEIEAGPADDISVRLIGEIARIVDDGSTRRVVPVVGRGPLQNVNDLKYLRGIDLAIIQADALDFSRQQKLLAGGDTLTYIAKLHNEELHLLVTSDIKTPADLAGKIVNTDLADSNTAFTAFRLFELLQIAPKIATDSQPIALDKLRKGEISGMAFVTAKPAALFSSIKPSDNLHFLSVPLTQTVLGAYAPTAITAADYPNLIDADKSVDTIAVGTVLMAADLHLFPERERNVRTFVETFYTGYQALLGTGFDPRWRDINIAADVPGWVRHPASLAWIRNNPQIAAPADAEMLQALFTRFIDEHRQVGGAAPMSASEKNALFQQFEAWQHGQPH
ncbi:MAG: TRAP transporter substrate-binding protein [Alphaproteobacteria bacterium]|nr:TRAP transporter substrate-binding protein [Alphaproteobacteria bacterium]